MKILFTGDYDPEYNRIQILLHGLKMRSDVSVIEFPVKSVKEFYTELSENQINSCDIVFLPSFTHKFVKPLRKRTRKPIIFDPLISKYLTKVFDYKQVWRYSPRALKNFFKDKIPFRNCDILLADTEAHKQYYRKTFGLKNQRIEVLPIGVDTDEFSSLNYSKPKDYVHVGFYGGFIPLQGTRHILDVAKLLKSNTKIQITLIGTGYEWEDAKDYAKLHDLSNVSFSGWVKQTELPAKIAEFDICLGIFGDSLKADLVVPNKVFHYAAARKPIITKDTPAMREIFTHDKDIFLVQNSPKAIAEAILHFAENSKRCSDLGQNAFDLVNQNFNHTAIAERFVRICKLLTFL